MKTLRYIFIATFLLTCLTHCSKEDSGNGSRFQLKTSDNLDDLDYRLYSLILNDLFPKSENLVVNQQSKADYPDMTYLHYLEVTYPEMDVTVFLDYKVKNDTVYSFENKFQVTSKTISMVTEEEINHIFGGTEDINKSWEEFYKRFPDSAGEISFTRIGYNTNKTQAMVEMGNIYASLGGEGYLIFLKLENDTWIITRAILTWMS